MGLYVQLYLQAQISRKPTTPVSQSLWQTHLQCRLLYRSPRHSGLSWSCKIRFSVSRNKFLQEIRNAFLGSGANARMRTYGTLDRRILGLYLPVISQHFLHIFDSKNPERFYLPQQFANWSRNLNPKMPVSTNIASAASFIISECYLNFRTKL